MFRKFRTALGALVTISACLLLIAPAAMADKASGAVKLEGAWVSKVVGFPGQWSYVLAPDPSGRRASGHGAVDVGFDPSVFGCMLGDTDSDSPILTDIKMTGPNTAVAYSVWYALREVQPSLNEIVYIGVVTSELKFVTPGNGEGTHYFAFYLPSQDLDPEDGFPDAGETPACVAPVPIYTLDTRLQLRE